MTNSQNNILSTARTEIRNAPVDTRKMATVVRSGRQGVYAPALGNMNGSVIVNKQAVNAPVAKIKRVRPVVANRQGTDAPVGKPAIRIGHRV